MTVLVLDAEVPDINKLLGMASAELALIVLEIARSRSRHGKFHASELLKKNEVIAVGGTDQEAKLYGGARWDEVTAKVDKALQRLIASGEIVPAYTSGASDLFHVEQLD